LVVVTSLIGDVVRSKDKRAGTGSGSNSKNAPCGFGRDCSGTPLFSIRADSARAGVLPAETLFIKTGGTIVAAGELLTRSNASGVSVLILVGMMLSCFLGLLCVYRGDRGLFGGDVRNVLFSVSYARAGIGPLDIQFLPATRIDLSPTSLRRIQIVFVMNVLEF
jgi:hypothetical protein